MFLIPSHFIIILLLLSSYPLASVLPVRMGWENGVLENIQILIILLGLLSALQLSFRSIRKQWRLFAWMVAPIWLILIGREWSWGATLVKSPIYVDPELGPMYSSLQLLEMKPMAYAIVGLLLLIILVIFITSQQYKSIVEIYQKKAFPWAALALAFAAAILCTAADGHIYIEVTGLTSAQQQILEELYELCMYLSLFLAQLYVRFKLRSFDSTNNVVHSKSSLSLSLKK